jgi:hypothetical protein
VSELRSSAELVGAIFRLAGVMPGLHPARQEAVALVDEHFRGIRETAKALAEALRHQTIRNHQYRPGYRPGACSACKRGESALQRAQEEGLGE